MAALIRKKTGIDAEIIEGGRGEFTVWVGADLVAKKDAGVFPEDDDVLAAVQRALGPDGSGR